ncbi:hypothetical protein CYMTET_40382 [Cymbomonas tetramitiformis]|uniref:Methyltransferase type 11 domain-containing protein n=1 Tax=Cymbomonas tetramitiformis TaxID=36881 RepID=A0AAE0C854_9CHLO|nr:hypothetical protein CYMTET_40382 [Cymbomonas tetramitiformis]
MRIAATAFAQASGQILGRRSLFGQYGSQTLAPAGLCLPFVREFAAVNDNTVMNVFDRQLKKLHRDRASVHISEEPLTSEIARRLLDRLKDCTRTFPSALILGGASLAVTRELHSSDLLKQAGITEMTILDSSEAMLSKVADSLSEDHAETQCATTFIHSDEEAYLNSSVQEGSVDVVIACLGLHWCNDLPGVLIQAKRVLKPDGLFLGALFGGDTLQELRIACSVAEQERDGGVSARISPFAKVSDGGMLLGRAGFNLPAVDIDTITMMYPNAYELVEHLRVMGETNAVLARRGSVSRDTALATAAAYQALFQEDDGSVPATFDAIFLTGWCPHHNQQRPDARGSATVSLKDLADLPASGDFGAETVRPR